MICAYYRWRISAAMDGENAAADLPHRHLRRCAACRAFHEQSRRLAAALRSERPPAGARIESPALARGRSRPVRRWAPAAVAAAAGLAVLTVALSGLLGPGPRGDPSPRDVARPQPPTPRAELPSTQELLAHAREPVESLASRLSQPIVTEIERTHDDLAAAGRTMIACLPLGFVRQPTDSDGAGDGEGGASSGPRR